MATAGRNATQMSQSESFSFGRAARGGGGGDWREAARERSRRSEEGLIAAIVCHAEGTSVGQSRGERIHVRFYSSLQFSPKHHSFPPSLSFPSPSGAGPTATTPPAPLPPPRRQPNRRLPHGAPPPRAARPRPAVAPPTPGDARVAAGASAFALVVVASRGGSGGCGGGGGSSSSSLSEKPAVRPLTPSREEVSRARTPQIPQITVECQKVPSPRAV